MSTTKLRLKARDHVVREEHLELLDVAGRLQEVMQPLTCITFYVQVAERNALKARSAPDSVAMFYDIARVDEALAQIRVAAERIQSMVKELRSSVLFS